MTIEKYHYEMNAETLEEMKKHTQEETQRVTEVFDGKKWMVTSVSYNAFAVYKSFSEKLIRAKYLKFASIKSVRRVDIPYSNKEKFVFTYTNGVRDIFILAFNEEV